MTSGVVDPALQLLFDIVESDRLIVCTGAGLSRDFVDVEGNRLPAWRPLLERVRAALEREGVTFVKADGTSAVPLLDAFNAEDHPRGEHLIELATILRRPEPKRFDELVERYLTPAPKQPDDVVASYSAKHRAIMALEPRGIVTFNVDRFHENYLESNGARWQVYDPINDDEELARKIARQLGDVRFLIKAHGTVKRRIVFDYGAYRDLIEKTPSYAALFSVLFSHYRMLFIGFGLSDLDFDLMIDTAVRRFGSPLQQHLTLRVAAGTPMNERELIGARMAVARTARLEERYGIRSLSIDPVNLAKILSDAATQPGVRLLEMIDQTTSMNLETRRRAHRDLRSLGTAGKRVAMKVLHDRVMNAVTATPALPSAAMVHGVSELTYSLGRIDLREHADRRRLASLLLEIAGAAKDVEVVAHALWALVSVVTKDELDDLVALRNSGKLAALVSREEYPAPAARCHHYLDALIARADAERLSPSV